MATSMGHAKRRRSLVTLLSLALFLMLVTVRRVSQNYGVLENVVVEGGTHKTTTLSSTSIRAPTSTRDTPRINETSVKFCSSHDNWLLPLHSNRTYNVSLDIHPIWVASYPGSGSELFRSLMEGMTGLLSDEMNHYRCRNLPPICKTHYPSYDRHTVQVITADPTYFVDHFSQSTMILLRNPSKALPSWFNWLWERQHKVKSHTQFGPEVDWKAWRNKFFNRQVQKWKSILTYWHFQTDTNMTVFPSSTHVALVLPYENLTSPLYGPLLLQDVHAQLQTSMADSGRPLLPFDYAPCLWHRVVVAGKSGNYASTNQTIERVTKRAKRTYTPSFTVAQKNTLLQVLDELITLKQEQEQQRSTKTSDTLLNTLVQYRNDIAHNLRLDGDIDPLHQGPSSSSTNTTTKGSKS